MITTGNGRGSLRLLGRALLLAGALAAASGSLPPAALAAQGESVKFTATVDRQQISVDESVTLKLSIESTSGSVGDPQFYAPDFELLNQYNEVQTQSYYDDTSGQITTKNMFEVNKVLKPMKTGALRISGIQVQVGGRMYHAPDVEVQVTSGGGGTPPPNGYGGADVGLRGAGKRSALPSVFVRAEVDRNQAYKGQQIVVSYYIYERVRAFNIEITKFPTLSGFLREELEMPYLNRKLDMQQVVLDGVAYARGLLVRYAAYPLQEGKLRVDPMVIKYNYYNSSDVFDNDDPFAGLFRQALPGNSTSEPITVQVMPLPEQGRPNSFSGGVGNFDIVSAVDKTEVHANQPVTMTVNIQGTGNVEAIGDPKAKWPDTVELYDSKGVAKAGKGVGQKTFEYLLIPRQPGPLTLPSLELSYFDPKQGKYITKTTDPIKINVLDPQPGTASPDNSQAASPALSAGGAPPVSQVRGLKAPGQVSPASLLSGLPMWRWIYWISIAAFGFFILLVGSDLLSKARRSASERSALRARAEAKSWGRLKGLAARMGEGMPWNEVVSVYEAIAGQIFDAIDRVYQVGSRSYSREELKRMLVDDRGLGEGIWKRAAGVLEFAELVRFASSAGAVSESAARGDGPKWVSEAEQVARLIENPPLKTSSADSAISL